MTPTQILLVVIAIVAIAVLLSIPVLRKALKEASKHWEDHDYKHGFLYEFIKDFAAPFLLAILGVLLAYQFNLQRDTEAENQRKAAILRDMMTTRNGPDVAFFTAVGERLTVHLRRYQKFRDPEQSKLFGEDAEKTALFDQRAIYFFYGMFRVARMDFLATKGYVLYPRVWMEEAFARITDSIIKDLSGSEEDDPKASPQEEAALYHYFGATRASYHTGSKSPNEAVPDLFDFNRMLEGTKEGSEPYVIELQRGFREFQMRWQNRRIDSLKIITSFEAITGLDDYAFNTLFSAWYREFRSDPPVRNLQCEPPEHFLPYPLDTFEFESDRADKKKEEWSKERQSAWEIILSNVPDSYSGKVTPCPSP